jgi:threonine dehydratase
MNIPTFADIETAAARIAPYAKRTPVLTSHAIDALTGAQIFFKCENLQRMGAFKFRGACNAVWALDEAQAARGVVTHSSGNHGAALALAASTRGIRAHVVVPKGAVETKVAAIKSYGATLHRCEPTQAARDALTEEVRAQTGATLVHPFTDPRVIAGQGTAALELLRETGPLDALIAPFGGGGLIGGSAIAAHEMDKRIDIYAAEPAGAADAFESLRRGERVTDIVPDTLCDGLRATLGAINFALLQQHVAKVLTVADGDTIAALRLIFDSLKIIVEPSSAIALAAILAQRETFAGRRVGVILSGGNIDLDVLPWS